MPTAAVCTGPALWLVAELLADWAPELADWTAEPAELVRLPISDVMEARSEPVAVDSADDSDAMALPASLVMELTSEDAAELIELTTEPIELVSDEMAAGLVLLLLPPPALLVPPPALWLLVSWAEARAAKAARRKVAERMLMDLMMSLVRFICNGLV